jgi:hypothetical protein
LKDAPSIIHESLGTVHASDVSPPGTVAPPEEPQLLSVLSSFHRSVPSAVLVIPSPAHTACTTRSFAPLEERVTVGVVLVPEFVLLLVKVVVWSTPVAEIAPLCIDPFPPQFVLRAAASVITTLLVPLVGSVPAGRAHSSPRRAWWGFTAAIWVSAWPAYVTPDMAGAVLADEHPMNTKTANCRSDPAPTVMAYVFDVSLVHVAPVTMHRS